MPLIQIAVVVVVAIGLVVVAALWGDRLLRHPEGTPGGGASDPFGGALDVFDPSRERARADLDSRERQGEAAPVPEHEPAMRVDLDRGRVHIRLPHTATPTPTPPTDRAPDAETR